VEVSTAASTLPTTAAGTRSRSAGHERHATVGAEDRLQVHGEQVDGVRADDEGRPGRQTSGPAEGGADLRDGSGSEIFIGIS
jgi:hypothetical protein